MTEGPAPADRAARFAALYDRHGREVWAVAYARRLDSHLALDLTHEAFLRLWQQWEAGAAIGNERAWLMRVVRNLAEDAAKSAFRRNGTQAPDSMADVRGREFAPPDALIDAETRHRVRAELNLLPPADREVLTLRYALEYDAGRVAELLGVSVTAVHMRLSRARQRLGERLTAAGVIEPP